MLTPAYPGFEIEVEALRENPDMIADLTVPETVDHLAGRSRLWTARRSSWATRSAGRSPSCCWLAGSGRRRRGRLRAHRRRTGQPALPGQVALPRAEEPGQQAPGGRVHGRAVPLRLHQHPHRRGVARLWERYAIAAPGNWVWAYGLIANFKPGHQETWVDYAADRAPLLFIAGEKDHIMPPSVTSRTPSTTRNHRR